MLRQQAALRQGDSLQRIRDALAYLVFIRDNHARSFDDNPRAAASGDGLLKQDVRYLAQEYLNEHWTSFYFADVAAMFATAGLGFVGSLPVFTNFWDLCVRPEFQELFQTTGNRLITEAHKDFCANTAFRWDIYAKNPRSMPDVADRLREADDLHFRVSRAGLTLPSQVDVGIVTSTIQGPLYDSLFRLLSDRSRPMSEVLADTTLAETPPQNLMRAVDAGVAMGLFDVSSGPIEAVVPEVTGGVSVPSSFNRMVLAADSLGGRVVALASHLTGTGHSLGDLDAAILHELVSDGVDGLVERLDTRLEASGRSLERDGQAVSDASERLSLVRAACEAFLTTSLPQLMRLGIVEQARPQAAASPPVAPGLLPDRNERRGRLFRWRRG